MPTLYDHRGNPVQSKQLTEELAAPGLMGVRTVWDMSVAGGLTPYRLASLLKGAAEGDHNDYLTLAEEMEERDLHYRCEIGKRKLAVAALPVTVEAASDTPQDKQFADEVRLLVRRPGFRGLLKDLLDGLGKGYSVCEINWQRGAKWIPKSFAWRDPRFFTFDKDTRTKLRLLDDADMVNGIELEPFKFITHIPHLKTGIPIRGGLARVAAFAWMAKNYTIKDWVAFVEVFGQPLRIGKYHGGATSKEIDILRAAVSNLGTDAAAVIPDSMLIEFVQSSKTISGSNDTYSKLAEWLDAQVSRGILGQTATTQGTPGKLGNENAQAEVREDIRDDDASQLAETINRDLIQPFIDLNFGPQQNYPELVLRAIEKDDLTILTTALEKLVPLGLKVEQSVVRDKFGLPDPEEGAECLGTQSAATPPVAEPPPQPQKAQNSEQNQIVHPVDTITSSMIAETNIDPVLDPVRQLLDEVSSLEEFRDRLLEMKDGMDSSELGALIQKALIVAELSGRFDARV